ncbi:hypothetical protein, partial [Vibrio sinaloensis]|uniref:hypothetical protein n=1 Tax=Photobacterium sp. (strain ATCC 43367) TaxID=379097 RepID=UPI002F416418
AVKVPVIAFHFLLIFSLSDLQLRKVPSLKVFLPHLAIKASIRTSHVDKALSVSRLRYGAKI